MKLFLLAALALVPSLSFAESDVLVLPLLNKTGVCPKDIKVGILGESYLEGLRFTVDIKKLLASDAKLEILGVDGNSLVFEGKLSQKWSHCNATTDVVSLAFPGSTYQVDLADGYISVNLRVIRDSGLNLVKTSTYNNQAIFVVAEAL